MNRILLAIAIAVAAAILAIILILAGVLPGRKPPTPTAATLEFWGVQDDESVWREILSRFRERYPHLTVSYREIDEATYEETLINRLAEGAGPDIFVLKNSWITKHRDKIFPLPAETPRFSQREFRRTFVDVAAAELIAENGTILGIPLSVDTPALFYNKDILNAAGIATPPRNWDEAGTIARSLTKRTPTGGVIRSGIALGSFENVEHALEILFTLIFQSGDPIIDARTKDVVLGDGAAEALGFFTSFADPTSANFSWARGAPHSLDAFAEGNAVMAFGTSQDLERLRAKNPHLNFGVVPFPQSKEARVPVVYGTYFFLAVSKFSSNPGAAWQFILSTTLGEDAKRYLEATKRPPARRDLIAAGPATPELDPFVRQGLIAKSWQVPDEKIVRGLFRDAGEAVLTRESPPAQALHRLREKVKLLLP